MKIPRCMAQPKKKGSIKKQKNSIQSEGGQETRRHISDRHFTKEATWTTNKPNTTIHLGTANWDYDELSLHTWSRWNENLWQHKMLARMWQSCSYTAFGNVKWYSHSGKCLAVASKNKHRFTIWPSNGIPGHLSWENENLHSWGNLYTQLFTAVLFVIAHNWATYSTGNYIRYTVINHSGKEYGKESIRITESLFYIAKITFLYSKGQQSIP